MVTGSKTAKELLAQLKKQARRRGWTVTTRAGKGSHMIVEVLDETGLAIAWDVVPFHPGDIKKGLLNAIDKNFATIFGKGWL